MIKIGFIGLDTSHPASFYEILSDMEDTQVVGVYDDRTIRTDEYVKEFVAKRDIKDCASLEELADCVDGVMVLAVNWDNHLDQARPFLDAGKAVYVDKPVAGNIKNLNEFIELAQNSKAPVMAGSGWRFNDKTLAARAIAAFGQAQFACAESHMPGFFYGIHGIELLLGVLGEDVGSVQALHWSDDEAEPEGSIIATCHDSGAGGLVRISANDYWRGAVYRINSTEEWGRVVFSGEDIHGAVCKKFVEVVRTGTSFEPAQQLGLSVKIMLAAQQSANSNGAKIEINNIDEQIRFDGNAFAQEYKVHGATPPLLHEK